MTFGGKADLLSQQFRAIFHQVAAQLSSLASTLDSFKLSQNKLLATSLNSSHGQKSDPRLVRRLFFPTAAPHHQRNWMKRTRWKEFGRGTGLRSDLVPKEVSRGLCAEPGSRDLMSSCCHPPPLRFKYQTHTNPQEPFPTPCSACFSLAPSQGKHSHVCIAASQPGLIGVTSNRWRKPTGWGKAPSTRPASCV